MTDKQKHMEEQLGAIFAPYWGKEQQPMAITEEKRDQADITSTLQTLYALLDELRSIDTADVLNTPYHPTLEAAYAAMGKVETEVDALGQELEFQHQRLDSARDARLSEATKESE